MTTSFHDDLRAFAEDHKFRGKGPLCVMLVVNEHAKTRGLPLDSKDLLTERKGQVLGLGVKKVQVILERHDISRVLAKEGGRTSRGSIDNMRAYVEFLNNQFARRGLLDLEDSEVFWVRQVQKFFASKPFVMKLDPSWGVRRSVQYLMNQALSRQRDGQGTMFLGTMMQHLVGAKLEVVLGGGSVYHHGVSESDQNPDRHGDFDLEDVAIHVSTAPSEWLIGKCKENLGKGKYPVIITTTNGAKKAELRLDDADLTHRVDVIEFEQFIATNVFEIGKFKQEGRTDAFARIVSAYNRIVAAHETDPGLKIEITAGK